MRGPHLLPALARRPGVAFAICLAVTTQLETFGLALLVVCGLVALQAGSLGLALASLVPNLVPVVGVIGLMGWLDLPVDVTNVLVAAVAIGIVVDDTVHLLHGYREARRTLPPRAALEQAVSVAGRAVLATSVVLAGAFASYLASPLGFVRVFGLLACLTFAAALLADLVLLPALLLAAGDDAPEA